MRRLPPAGGREGGEGIFRGGGRNDEVRLVQDGVHTHRELSRRGLNKLRMGHIN